MRKPATPQAGRQVRSVSFVRSDRSIAAAGLSSFFGGSAWDKIPRRQGVVAISDR
jgi:hypothetical protein